MAKVETNKKRIVDRLASDGWVTKAAETTTSLRIPLAPAGRSWFRAIGRYRPAWLARSRAAGW